MKIECLNRFPFQLMLVLSSIFFGCKEAGKEPEVYKILDQNFLSIIDTLAYDYKSLRPAPNLEVPNQHAASYYITVYDHFISFKKWADNVSTALENKNPSVRKKYKALILKWIDKGDEELNIHNLKNTGLFKLVATADKSVMRREGFVGHVKFSEVLSDGRIALLVAVIQDNIKSGVERLFLFEKQKNKWLIVGQKDLIIW